MNDELSELCAELQGLQRMRAGLIKSRVMAENNRRAFVANHMGYSTAADEKARQAMFEKADKLIAAVLAGKEKHAAGMFIHAAEGGISAFQHAQKATEKEMLPLAKKTPVAAWALAPEQRGFGLLSLATVIGETGDLRLYANPGKVWRRLGCAPWTCGDKTQMGSTWKSKGGLNAEQWSAFGYSPRRRSIAFVIGENLVKQNTMRTAGGGGSNSDTDHAVAAPGNKQARAGEPPFDTEGCDARASRKRGAKGGELAPVTEMKGASLRTRKPRVVERSDATDEHLDDAGANGSGGGDFGTDTDTPVASPGPYRARYDAIKAHVMATRPDWTCCRTCTGTGKTPKGTLCGVCKGKGTTALHAHRHAMLLATKLLLKNLWKAWCPSLDRGDWRASNNLIAVGGVT